MRKIGKWALTLGLLSAFPGLTLAAEPQQSASRSTASADKSTNQKAAENIAKALRAARIKGEGIEIEYRDGVATLRGTVAEPEMRQRAEMATSRVPGIQSVKNELRAAMPVADKPGVDPFLAESRVTQASFDGDGRGSRVQPVDYAPAASDGNNQEVAEQIAASMSAAQLRGYDIEVMYQDGVCSLVGNVPTNAQRMAAEQAARAVPAVRAVRNNLQTTQEPSGPAQGMGGYPGMGGPGMPPAGIHPAAYQPGAMGPGGPAGPGGPMPMASYGHGQPMGNPAMYNGPAMPEHAWPSYAQYPNSAAVTYPQQYSASAWPYIGPFYPYPQVPLGWRDATLRWDDGQWNLQFRQRTDRWWWFLSPKNW